jgi:hypothetical protein
LEVNEMGLEYNNLKIDKWTFKTIKLILEKHGMINIKGSIVPQNESFNLEYDTKPNTIFNNHGRRVWITYDSCVGFLYMTEKSNIHWSGVHSIKQDIEECEAFMNEIKNVMEKTDLYFTILF